MAQEDDNTDQRGHDGPDFCFGTNQWARTIYSYPVAEIVISAFPTCSSIFMLGYDIVGKDDVGEISVEDSLAFCVTEFVYQAKMLYEMNNFLSQDTIDFAR